MPPPENSDALLTERTPVFVNKFHFRCRFRGGFALVRFCPRCHASDVLFSSPPDTRIFRANVRPQAAFLRAVPIISLIRLTWLASLVPWS